MRLSLPYPISANRYWRSFRGRDGQPVVVVSDEAKVFKQSVGWISKQAGIRAPVGGLLELRIILHPIARKTISAKDVRCMDLDNALKVSIDALSGICYADDKQIRRLVAERGEPVPGGALAVEILRYEERKAA